MIFKRLQSIHPEAQIQGAKQADDEERRVRKESKLVDAAHEALVKRAAEDKSTLDTLVRMGWPYVKRAQFKGKVRKKVWDIVSQDSDFVDTDMVEDITERIVDAAEVDPYYKKMFEKE